jgi:phage-related protein
VDVVILDNCRKEIYAFPEEVRKGFLDLVEDLTDGYKVEPPVSKKMSSVGKNVFELRIKDKSGNFRIIYFVKKKEAIYLIHAFMKKTQKTPKRNLELAKKRIRRLI